MPEFQTTIISWYHQNKRNLPWRETTNPYFIWLSEIILQQTRIEQGTSYYLKFIKRFPTIKDLAQANEQEVLNLWQGLGYYSRARNLHTTAKYIYFDLKGEFPKNFAALILLKGVGVYTASAIASFAYNESKAVVDGNVYRVLSRVFNVETPIDSGIGKKEFQNLADELISSEVPNIYNQAIMEFGALHCLPANPLCEKCPLQFSCLSFAAGTIKIRPVKNKKVKISPRYFVFNIAQDAEGKIAMIKRTEKDIWQNLYQFPLFEFTSQEKKATFLQAHNFDFVSKEYKHILSHQHIFATFVFQRVKKINLQQGEQKLFPSQIDDFPIPRLIEKFLEEESAQLFS